MPKKKKRTGPSLTRAINPIRLAAGVTKSWRSNRLNALKAYHEKLAYYEALEPIKQQACKKPEWNEYEPHRQA